MFGRRRKTKATPVPTARHAKRKPLVIVTVKKDKSGVFIQSMGSHAVLIPRANLHGLIALLAGVACDLSEN